MTELFRTIGADLAAALPRLDEEDPPIVPILRCVLIEVSGGGIVTATRTDMEVSVRAQVPAWDAADHPGIAVPAGPLLAIAEAAGSNQLIVSVSGKDFNITTDRFSATLETDDPDDFPRMKVPTEWPYEFCIPASDLRQAFLSVQHAISDEETRYYLNGIYLHTANGALRAVATDGHRLAYKDLPVALNDFKGAIVPRTTVEKVLHRAARISANPRVRISDDKIEFEFTDTVIRSKLIDGTFPEYERVIPKDNQYVMVADRLEVLDAVAMVSALTGDSRNPVAIECRDGASIITCRMAMGAGRASFILTSASYAGPNITYAFQARYLIDALTAMTGQTVEFVMKEPGAGFDPVIVRTPNDPTFLAVLMPMRL